jgi:hypothetical protein
MAEQVYRLEDVIPDKPEGKCVVSLDQSQTISDALRVPFLRTCWHVAGIFAACGATVMCCGLAIGESEYNQRLRVSSEGCQ